MSRPTPGHRHRGPKSRHPHVDLIAVDQACAGRDVLLTVPERRLVVSLLRQRGIGPREIARRLRLSDRSVHRLGKQAPPEVDGWFCLCPLCQQEAA